MQTDAQFLADIEAATDAFIGRLREWKEHKIDPDNPGAITLQNRIIGAIDNLEPLLMIMPGVKSYAIAKEGQAAMLAADAAKLGVSQTPSERPARVMVTEDEDDASRLLAVIQKIKLLSEAVRALYSDVQTWGDSVTVRRYEEASDGLLGLSKSFEATLERIKKRDAA